MLNSSYTYAVRFVHGHVSWSLIPEVHHTRFKLWGPLTFVNQIIDDFLEPKEASFHRSRNFPPCAASFLSANWICPHDLRGSSQMTQARENHQRCDHTKEIGEEKRWQPWSQHCFPVDRRVNLWYLPPVWQALLQEAGTVEITCLWLYDSTAQIAICIILLYLDLELCRRQSEAFSTRLPHAHIVKVPCTADLWHCNERHPKGAEVGPQTSTPDLACQKCWKPTPWYSLPGCWSWPGDLEPRWTAKDAEPGGSSLGKFRPATAPSKEGTAPVTVIL